MSHRFLRISSVNLHFSSSCLTEHGAPQYTDKWSAPCSFLSEHSLLRKSADFCIFSRVFRLVVSFIIRYLSLLLWFSLFVSPCLLGLFSTNFMCFEVVCISVFNKTSISHRIMFIRHLTDFWGKLHQYDDPLCTACILSEILPSKLHNPQIIRQCSIWFIIRPEYMIWVLLFFCRGPFDFWCRKKHTAYNNLLGHGFLNITSEGWMWYLC